MTHTTKHGAPRLLERCELALTALGVVKRVYTDLAVVDVGERGFVARELIHGLSLQMLQEKTGAPIQLAADCRRLEAPARLEVAVHASADSN